MSIELNIENTICFMGSDGGRNLYCILFRHRLLQTKYVSSVSELRAPPSPPNSMLLVSGFPFFGRRGFWVAPTWSEEILHRQKQPRRDDGPTTHATLKLGEGGKPTFEPEATALSQKLMSLKYAIFLPSTVIRGVHPPFLRSTSITKFKKPAWATN